MITDWKDLTPTQVVALKGFGGEQGIYVRASMLRALKGDGSAAILLSQLIYWSQSEIAKKNDGWFYLTTQRITEELGMSRYVQERVRGMMVEAGILEVERRGNPAKNWYRLHLDRVIDLLADQFYVQTEGDDGNPPSSTGQNPHPVGGNPAPSAGENPILDGGNTPNIVNTLVNRKVKIYRQPSVTPTSGRRRVTVVNVLAEEFDRYVGQIQANYPLNWQGLPVTEAQARRALKKMGDIKPDASDEERVQAQDRVRELVRAIKNIKKAVEIGDLETRYVPGFDKFAGLGISYGQEPAFHAWALKVFVEKKPKLVV